MLLKKAALAAFFVNAVMSEHDVRHAKPVIQFYLQQVQCIVHDVAPFLLSLNKPLYRN